MASLTIVATGSTTTANTAGISKDYVSGETLTFTNPTYPSPATQLWELIDAPLGQTSVILNPTTSTPTLLLDSDPGSFRVRHTADGIISELIFSILVDGLRIPGYLEKDSTLVVDNEAHYNRDSNSKGWMPALADVIKRVANTIKGGVADQFASLTEKVAPVGADLMLIEDSAAAGAKKKVQLSNLPGGGGGGGALQYVDHIVVSGSAANRVTFGASGDGVLQTALDGDADYEYLIVARMEKAGTSEEMVLEFNGDTGSNYASEYIQVTGGSVSGSNDTNDIIWSNTSFESVYSRIHIQALTINTNVDRNVIYDTAMSNTGSDAFSQRGTGVWANGTDNITSIELSTLSGSNRIEIDSRFDLYKIVPA